MARHTLLGVIGIGLQLISVAMVIAALATTMWTSWQTAGNNPSSRSPLRRPSVHALANSRLSLSFASPAVNMGLWKQCVTNSGVTSCVK